MREIMDKRKSPLKGLVLNLKPGEVVTIGDAIKISAELLPGSRNNEISVVIDCPRSIEIKRKLYSPGIGVLDSNLVGKNENRFNK